MLNTTCLEHLEVIFNIRSVLLPWIQAYNIFIGILNITGNAILIWALRRTGQTKTISFQFITIMSLSDLSIGTIGIVCLTLILTEQYREYCWLRLATLAALNTFIYFSAFMVFLIALDRYLHMKYLERYSSKFTKKRGYLLVIISFLSAFLIGLNYIRPYSQKAYNIFQLMIILMAILYLISVILLYRRALHILRVKGHQVTRSIISQNRALGKAAKRVSICFTILIGTIIFYHILDSINKRVATIDSDILITYFWFAYITFLGNGFCSSIIFISHNIKIQKLLKRMVMGHWNSIRPTVGDKDANA